MLYVKRVISYALGPMGGSLHVAATFYMIQNGCCHQLRSSSYVDAGRQVGLPTIARHRRNDAAIVSADIRFSDGIMLCEEAIYGLWKYARITADRC